MQGRRDGRHERTPGGSCGVRVPVESGTALLCRAGGTRLRSSPDARGSELVLMRFGDALNELGGTEGMQIHRSRWIARSRQRRSCAGPAGPSPSWKTTRRRRSVAATPGRCATRTGSGRLPKNLLARFHAHTVASAGDCDAGRGDRCDGLSGYVNLAAEGPGGSSIAVDPGAGRRGAVGLSADFARSNPETGRPLIAQERLLRARLLLAFCNILPGPVQNEAFASATSTAPRNQPQAGTYRVSVNGIVPRGIPGARAAIASIRPPAPNAGT